MKTRKGNPAVVIRISLDPKDVKTLDKTAPRYVARNRWAKLLLENAIDSDWAYGQIFSADEEKQKAVRTIDDFFRDGPILRLSDPPARLHEGPGFSVFGSYPTRDRNGNPEAEQIVQVGSPFVAPPSSNDPARFSVLVTPGLR